MEELNTCIPKTLKLSHSMLNWPIQPVCFVVSQGILSQMLPGGQELHVMEACLVIQEQQI